MSIKKDTICWECEWAAGKDKKCPWATKFEPVPGWNATPTTVKADSVSLHKEVNSFIVHDCPLFEPIKVIEQRKEQNEDLRTEFYRAKEEAKKTIIELRKQGNTVKEIAYITGRTTKTIYRILRRVKSEVEQ